MNKIRGFLKQLKKPLICIIISLFAFVLFSNNILLISFAEDNSEKEDLSIYESSEIHQYENNSVLVHMLDLKNTRHGDCTIIKYGDTEVLIDAGGSTNSGESIYNALDYYCNDNVIEYVILSHGDEDHIINFYSLNTGFRKWLLETDNRCDVLIDFDVHNDGSITSETYKCLSSLFKEKNLDNDNSEDNVRYAEYKSFRDSQILLGKINNYFSASQITYYLTNRKVKVEDEESSITAEIIQDTSKSEIDAKELEILKKVEQNDGFYLYKNPQSSSGKSNVKLKILYNYFYDHSYKQDVDKYTAESVDNNLLSVCAMLAIGKEPFLNSKDNREKYLFTGDLEEYDSSKNYVRVYGETKLIENNSKEFTSPFTFYKAAHHGSSTSNSIFLLDVIRPKYVGISCSAFGVWNFPSQNTITNLTKYTDYVYITGIKEEDYSVPYYGNISFKYDLNDMTMDVKYDTSEPQSIISSTKFLDKRSFNVNVYNLTDIYGEKKEENIHYDAECTYIKMGHIDILVDLGNSNNDSKNENIKKNINILCNDGVLDYLIISCAEQEYYNGIFSSPKKVKGLLDDSSISINEVSRVFISKYYKESESETSKYEGFKNTLYKTKIIKSVKEIYFPETISLFSSDSLTFELEFLNHMYINKPGKNAYQNGIPFVLSLDMNLPNNSNNIFTYMNLGGIYGKDELTFIKENNKFNNKVTIFQIPKNGYVAEKQDVENVLKPLIKEVKNPNEFVCLLNSTKGKKNIDNKDLIVIDSMIEAYITNQIIDNTQVVQQYAGNLCVRVYCGDLSKVNVRSNVLCPHFELSNVKNYSDDSSLVYNILVYNIDGSYSTKIINNMSKGHVASYYENKLIK